MKLAIISDTHDNFKAVDLVLDYLVSNEIELLISCGDVAKAEVLEYIRKKFNKTIYVVLGNADIDTENFQDKNAKIFKKIGLINVDGKKIFFIHKPADIKNDDSYDYIFYGHTHRPDLKQKGKTLIVNPGNVAGLMYKGSFAVLDTKTGKLELILLENLRKDLNKK